MQESRGPAPALASWLDGTVAAARVPSRSLHPRIGVGVGLRLGKRKEMDWETHSSRGGPVPASYSLAESPSPAIPRVWGIY